VTPDTGGTAPAGAGIFSYSQAGILITESGIPAAVPTTRARIWVDQSGTRTTGLAIANPSESEISVTYRAFESDGSTPAGESGPPLALKGNEHVAQYVPQMLSGLRREFSGVLEISSASPFVALTLQSLTNSRGHVLLTTFPVADATQPAPAPVVFPQVADGGGYMTRFVLLAVGAPSTVDLLFCSDDGTPLAIGSSKGAVK
jgi:hypothetical protein